VLHSQLVPLSKQLAADSNEHNISILYVIPVYNDFFHTQQDYVTFETQLTQILTEADVKHIRRHEKSLH